MRTTMDELIRKIHKLNTDNSTIKNSFTEYKNLVEKCLLEKEDQIQKYAKENSAFLSKVKTGKFRLLKADEEIIRLIEKVALLKKKKKLLKEELKQRKAKISNQNKEQTKTTEKGIKNTIKSEPIPGSTPIKVKKYHFVKQGYTMYTCDICKKTFKTRGVLYNHITQKHSEEKYNCDRCPKSYVNIYQYRYHLKAHEKRALKKKIKETRERLALQIRHQYSIVNANVDH